MKRLISSSPLTHPVPPSTFHIHQLFFFWGGEKSLPSEPLRSASGLSYVQGARRRKKKRKANIWDEQTKESNKKGRPPFTGMIRPRGPRAVILKVGYNAPFPK